ncbi:3'-5' exonuclease [Taibaiella lutea]|uniref:3'-5' exonuclease n=1 Tax=Taibaiella lutea TaxID=2608001 RepID=A0A5M6CQW5_9BACT|nr:3'-5' exonuclease [Taibaiella lutea]KAA5537356.1 3'-5' exonuclease [Taibaiella lutea]
MHLKDFSSLANFTAIDFETANGKFWSICQVGLVRVEQGVIVKELEILVQPPGNEYHWGNSRVHGITKKDTAEAPDFAAIWPQIKPYISGQHVVAHNASFDCTSLRHTLEYYKLPRVRFQQHCTVEIYKRKLSLLCNQYNIELIHHNALSDAKACAQLFMMHLEGKSAAMVQEMELLHPAKQPQQS